MSDEEIKKQLRHSFTNPFREDLPKPKINQFGHTILTDNDDFNPTDVNVEVDQNGNISANPKTSIFESEQFSKLVQDHLDKSEVNSVEVNSFDVKPIESNFLSKLIAELDDMKEDKSKPFLKPEPSNVLTINEPSNIAQSGLKNCLNKECMYNLAKDAKFCSKCGTYQMPKFCTECGYSFSGMEKFCPDCGTKR